MRLDSLEEKRFYDLLGDVINNENVQKMKDYIAHGKITVFDHSISVAKVAFFIFLRFGLKLNIRKLLLAAILHDFYLYDWHKNIHADSLLKMHGFTHPLIAAKNAKQIFNIDEETSSMIESHMWPLTITRWPKTKEAWILTLSDKIVALDETLFKRR